MIIHQNIGRIHGPQSHSRAQDHPRQAHTTHGGPKNLGMVNRGAQQDLTGGSEQPEIQNKVGKRSVLVMVLAVNVSGDGAAHGHELGSGGHGEKPSTGKKVLNDFGEAHAAFTFKLPRSGIEGKEPVQQDVPNHAGVFVQCGVTVAASEAAGNVGGFDS